jgi:DNA repair protein RecN (Recombination protein N)
MLSHLQLRDLVIVDQAELEFGAGMTALTGETGAGKSIVVDALLLIAGGRSGADIVRQGAQRAEVSASFTELPAPAIEWLRAQSIEFDGEVVVRRVIGADGRSRAYINGQVVPLSGLRELADFLIEIHGQQEFQHLVSRTAQRELLDERLSEPGLKTRVAKLYARYKQVKVQHESLQGAAQNRDARLDLLRFQCQELKAEVGSVEAIETLFLDQKRIAGRGRLATAATAALTAAYESDAESAHGLLGKANATLRGVSELDPKLAEAGKLLGEAAILTQEAAETLRRYLDALEMDPQRQDAIERQAAALEALARKHRVGVLELPAKLEQIAQELIALEQVEHGLASLEAELAQITLEYRQAANELSRARQEAAQRLGDEVSALMQVLGMTGGKFAVSIAAADAEFAASGSDEIEFLVSANPGQVPKSLAKVASGGELSRISLAVQVAGRMGSSSLCMVFDEVDAGIGGAVAEIVGRQLRELGTRAQVLCVTHLAQVASQAHGQFRVTKLSDGKITRTAVKPLSEAERVDEIARMLGGLNITEQALAHARDMLSRATPVEVKKKQRARAAPR